MFACIFDCSYDITVHTKIIFRLNFKIFQFINCNIIYTIYFKTCTSVGAQRAG